MSEPVPIAPVEVELRDGRRVRLRQIRPDDREEIRQAFGRLSTESRYTRFMAAVRDLTPRMLDRAVGPAGARELGVVAEIDAPDGIDLVGGARYYVQPGGDSCEFAVTVVDDWQGIGLASRLLRELIRGARARGLRRMEGFVLARNDRMLRLAERLGFSVDTDPDDAAVKIVRLDLTASSGNG
ncbi:MAG TPA: GNAT family N-acetyltransferase [Methylomirabilota bacterium]|jgi:RimJ/RimL family protein N-acetyltransferase